MRPPLISLAKPRLLEPVDQISRIASATNPRPLRSVRAFLLIPPKIPYIQKAKYWNGIGADTNPIDRLIAGILGDGCHSLIKEVYKHIIEEAPMPDDEVWLFGFSRGAYVVRAVAGLFQHIRAINSPRFDFDVTFEEGLKIHREIKWGNGFKRPGAVS